MNTDPTPQTLPMALVIAVLSILTLVVIDASGDLLTTRLEDAPASTVGLSGIKPGNPLVPKKANVEESKMLSLVAATQLKIPSGNFVCPDDLTLHVVSEAHRVRILHGPQSWSLESSDSDEDVSLRCDSHLGIVGTAKVLRAPQNEMFLIINIVGAPRQEFRLESTR